MKKILLTLTILLLTANNAMASNYYESHAKLSRNQDKLFNSCCCKKSVKNGEHQYYQCSLIDAQSCPNGSELYSNNGIDCPGDLVFTSYTKNN